MLGRLLFALAATAALLAPSLTLVPEGASSAPRMLASRSVLDDAATLGPYEAPAAGVVVSRGGEPMVLADKLGQYVWIGDFAGVHATTDGATFTSRNPPSLPGVFLDGVALAQDDNGVLYSAETQGQFIGIAKSTNGGVTWTVVNYVGGAASIADRPWIAARGNGELALVYWGDANEMCFHSSDGGVTWDMASVGNRVNAGNLVFDEGGKLYYATDGLVNVWRNGACRLAPLGVQLPASGAQIFHQVAVAGTGPYGGDMFVAQPSPGNGAMQLVGMHGALAPNTKVLTVSAPAVKSNTFGAVAARADGSEVAVAWYGSAAAGNPSSSAYPASASWNVYVARVTDFWSATPTVDVTLVEADNHRGWFCMGGISCTSGRALADYMGIAYAPDGSLHVSWGHDVGGVDVRYADLG